MDVKPYIMTSSKQLNIRIKFVPQKPASLVEEAAYIYHWQRITGAALLSITALALCIYGVVNYLQPAQHSMAAKIEKPHSPAAAQESTAKQPAAEDKAAITASSNNSPGATATTAEKAQPDSKTITAAGNSIDSSAEGTRQAPARFSPVLTHPDSEIFSKQIQPFVITQSVKNKQPVGSIHDIKPDVNNIITVYAYSKVLGLKGETLYYKWRLNGKDVAQVKVKIGSDRWRSYSRKFIQSHM